MGRPVGAEHWFPLYLHELQRLRYNYNVREIGIYVGLLAHQWVHGSIPQSEMKLANDVLGFTREEYTDLDDNPDYRPTIELNRVVADHFPKVQGRGSIRRNKKLHQMRERMLASRGRDEAMYDKAAGL